MFKNERFLTRGISEEVSVFTQLFLWDMVDKMPVEEKDYLQIFDMSETEDGMQKIVHRQEVPEYKAEYVIKTFGQLVDKKIYVIDDGEHSTMLFADEY